MIAMFRMFTIPRHGTLCGGWDGSMEDVGSIAQAWVRPCGVGVVGREGKRSTAAGGGGVCECILYTALYPWTVVVDVGGRS
jgi:hypothetical protein